MKKLIKWLAATAIIICLLYCASALAAEGTCGTGVNWELDDNGTLTISGSGYMTSNPWINYLNIKKVIISNGVENIYDNAFTSCSGITEVSISGSVTNIGNSAFSGCTGLVSINIPNSVTSIGEYAFYNCTGLKTVTTPSSMTRLGRNAFNLCEKLEGIVIPAGVSAIESETFRGCSSLESVTIPNSVTSIGAYAFAFCSELDRISIPDSVTSFGAQAFQGCSNLGSVSIPKGTTSISYGMFYECKSLQSVSIPDSITEIGSMSFYGCTALSGISLPSKVTVIGNSAFYNCGNLTTLTIPDDVTRIGEYAFYKCVGLTGIALPVKITEISKGAFEECFGLKTVNMQSPYIASFGSNVFKNCFNLTKITVAKLNLPAISSLKEAGYESILSYASSDIGLCQFEDLYDWTYTGSAIEPDVELRYWYGDSYWSYTSLVNGTDYTLSYKNNVNAGMATVIATGINGLTGSIEAAFTILPVNVSYWENPQGLVIDPIEEQTYSGTEIKPTPSVTWNGKRLAEGTDYSVKYYENTYVGTGTVELNFTGNFKGSREIDFKIGKVPISDAVVSATDQIYTGKEIKPTITVTWHDQELKSGDDYSVEYSNNINAGAATITLTGKGCFKDEKVCSFTILPLPMTEATVAAIPDQIYTGMEIKPTIWAVWNHQALSEGTDYTVAYQDNIQVGTAKAILTGIGNFGGEYEIPFKIVSEAPEPIKINLFMAVIRGIPNQVYTGKAIKPKITVTCKGITLTEGTDYTVAYKNNQKIGKATVTITGIGNYTGSKSATFSIVPKAVKISRLKAGQKSLTIQWKKGSTIDGYEIQYGLKKDFKGAKKITVSDAKTISYEIKKLKAQKVYYVRIRTFKKAGGKKYYSEWSKTLSKKTQ